MLRKGGGMVSVDGGQLCLDGRSCFYFEKRCPTSFLLV